MPTEAPMPRVDRSLLWIGSVLLTCLLVSLGANLVFQFLNYRAALAVTLNNPFLIDNSAVIAYARSWDAAVVKTSSLFLGYVLIFFGALFVLRTAESTFRLSVDVGPPASPKALLESTSPGLILATLGVVLVAVSLTIKSDVQYMSQRTPDYRATETLIPVGPSEEAVKF